MRPPTKRQKVKISKRLAIATIAIAALTYVFREIVREDIKELHDSLASAEAQFRNQGAQSAVSTEFLQIREEIENLELQKATGQNKSKRDYSTLIAQNILATRQAQANLNADFDSLSHLIDKFPARIRDAREFRDKLKEQIDLNEKQVNEVLQRKSNRNGLEVESSKGRGVWKRNEEKKAAPFQKKL